MIRLVSDICLDVEEIGDSESSLPTAQEADTSPKFVKGEISAKGGVRRIETPEKILISEKRSAGNPEIDARIAITCRNRLRLDARACKGQDRGNKAN